MRQRKVTISVVVLTRDRPLLLARCLASLVRQTIKPTQVIIIDGSKKIEETRAVVNRVARRLPVAIYLDRKQSIPYARNLGVRLAKGDIVAFLDDDLIAHKDYLRQIVEHFNKNSRLTAVMGRIKNALPQNACAATQFAYYDRGLRQHFPNLTNTQRLTAGRMLDCEVAALRRSIIARVGFIHPRPSHYRNEDVELGLRLMLLGKRMLFDPTITVLTHPRTQLLPLWVVAFRNGYSNGLIEKQYGVDLKASPYPSRFLPWLFHEVLIQSPYGPLKKIWYAFLLVSFPAVTRLGKAWYDLLHSL